MPPAPYINNIAIYPVKSFDGISVHKAMVTEGGCLQHDREYAIIDEKGNIVNGKSNAMVHTLRSNVDFENEIISFRPMQETTWRQFHLQKEKVELEAYLSDYFSKKVFFDQDLTGRFMDIPDIAGSHYTFYINIERSFNLVYQHVPGGNQKTIQGHS